MPERPICPDWSFHPSAVKEKYRNGKEKRRQGLRENGRRETDHVRVNCHKKCGVNRRPHAEKASDHEEAEDSKEDGRRERHKPACKFHVGDDQIKETCPVWVKRYTDALERLPELSRAKVLGLPPAYSTPSISMAPAVRTPSTRKKIPMQPKSREPCAFVL